MIAIEGSKMSHCATLLSVELLAKVRSFKA